MLRPAPGICVWKAIVFNKYDITQASTIAMIWFTLAIGAALGTAGMRLVNQHYHLNGLHLAVLVKLCLAIATAPFALLLEWPDNPVYYAAILCTVPIALFSDSRTFDLCSTYGGGPVSRIGPLDNILIFVVWTGLNISLLHEYIEQPLRFALIGIAVIGSVGFALKMRESRLSWAVFKACLPVIVATSSIVLLNKTAMDSALTGSGAILYIFLQASLMAIGGFGLVYARARRDAAFRIAPSKSLYAALALITLASLLHLLCKNFAFMMVENPAYVNIVNLTAPLWILAFNRFTGYPDNIKIFPGLGLVGCAAVLVAATGM